MYLICLICLHGCNQESTTNEPQQIKQEQFDLVSYVNPLMGTDSKFSLSNGNTYPAITRPWGMHFWTPQTAPMGDGWAYAYDAETIRGIKQTHQPSPWINDYGAFSLMAVTGSLEVEEEKRASWFSHKAEIAKPNHYSVYLAEYDATMEVTPTDRAAIFRFTFPETDSAYILIDGFNMGSMVKILPEQNKVIGYSRNNHGGVADNFHNYWVAEFDRSFNLTATWNDWQLDHESLSAEADHVGAVLGFKTEKGGQIQVKVASSFISHEQAQRNLDQEVKDIDFETAINEGFEHWNQELNRIQVEGGTEAQRETFYSCLYRTMLFPRPLHEFNAAGEMVHYSPYNGKVLPGYLYTDNGFWDTFRAVFPFFTLMYQDLNSQIMQGLVNTYKESGWLPEWASPGHRNVMIGSNSASLIADSYLKGIRDYDIEVLYEAIIKNTDSVGPVSSVGRLGNDYYNELGYIPYDVGIRENTSRTLEYAYADFTISELAKALDKPEAEIEKFRKRALNYQVVFDSTHQLMRARNQDGSFQSPFDPFKWGDAFTEGNSWHYTWSVFQDIQGLIDLMGGKNEFVAMLDSVFTMPPVYNESYYGFVIHEIREMQIVDMGQYAHGNQPVQHMVYLYNYAGQPWKTQYWVREVMDKLYQPTPDGYCGDEDNGQTSAWYVFSALGFYPVTPGVPQYVIGSPLFDRVTMNLENGNQLILKTSNNGSENRYIESMLWNGVPYDNNYFDHFDLMKGGEIEFQMSSEPDFTRGTDEDSFPYSMSRE